MLVCEKEVDQGGADEAGHEVHHNRNRIVARRKHLHELRNEISSEESCGHVEVYHNLVILMLEAVTVSLPFSAGASGVAKLVPILSSQAFKFAEEFIKAFGFKPNEV